LPYIKIIFLRLLKPKTV